MNSSEQMVPDSTKALIRKLYAGINRYDIDFVISLLHEDVIRIEPEGFPTAGTYSGHADLHKHLMTGRSTWAEGACEPVDFIAAGSKVVVHVHIKVRLKNKSAWIDTYIADGFVIKDGLVLAFHSFADKQSALKWAGIDE